MSSQATLSQVDAASSLLSLSIAAAGAPPIPIPDRSQSAGSGATPGVHGASFNGSQGVQGSPASTGLGTGARHHRRLSSTGKARRRLSDARDAANRPSPALLQSSAPALSLASLSLSTSLPAKSQPLVPTLVTSANGIPGAQAGQPSSLPLSDGDNIPSSAASAPAEPKVSESTPVSIGPGKSGRKRGVDHRCESCSKVYRHPSCLIKHRWEHTTHWREASKFVLSKHQQVQLLEAAAILSHLHPSAQSLPEDRSLWPSFLSGGSLPKVEPASPPTNGTTTHPVSSSVPAAGNFYRSTSSGPRLHDYSIPASSTGSGGITQLRPGVLGVPAGSGTMGDSTASKPVPVPTNVNPTSDSFRGYRGATADSWTSSPFENGHTPSSFLSTGLSSGSAPFPHSDERSVGTGAGGWSLPRSSVRSVSASSQSRSRSGSASGSRSDEESVDVDLDGYVDECSTSRYAGRYNRHGRGSRTWKREEDEMSIGFSVREEDEGDDDGAIGGGGVRAGVRKEPEWDGLEMDMDMD
ncbi:putative C2H2 finger domain protein [Lyophyllum shimeji]|uniref:C2H2 finger domain protein n=1 Tax=Lyophyllum shimeji TaxID=47721 RepID=A0A9P3PTI5_LYOSH|nr:putative C2H2 finger domain protein [Lyophyllum shimeji]